MNIHKPHKETQKSDIQKHNFHFTVTSLCYSYLLLSNRYCCIAQSWRFKLSRAFTYGLISALAEVSELFD